MSSVPDRIAGKEMIQRYETMRQRRCSGDDGGDRLGLAVLLELGVSAWVHQQALTAPVATAAEDSAPRTLVREHAGEAVVPGELHAQVAQLLAVMAIESIQSARKGDVR